jgi:uncharacterized protein (TIGR02647 family)
MNYNSDLIDELHILKLYNLESMQEGIKIHSTASCEMVAAAARLFNKGIISQKDGGYLTPRGLEAAKHAHALIGLLSHLH